MRRVPLIMALLLASLLATATATAGGPPVINTTTHFIDEPFSDVGLNCASGNLAQSNGVFSGVIHTLAQADGSLNVSVKTRGTDTLDDLPTDGIIDATTTFVFNSNDIVFATGKEVPHFTGTGTLTVTATGAELRFQVVIQVVLDEDGNPKVDLLRFVCD
jgi:hypothetical protein